MFVLSKAHGQLARNAQEVWPAIDVYYHMSDKLRLYSTASGTKKETTAYTDGALGIFLDVFGYSSYTLWRKSHNEELLGKYFLLRVGYQYSASPENVEIPYNQSLIVLQTDNRFNLPLNILFTARNRFDLRIKSDVATVRYRPRLILDRDFKTEFLFFTLSAFMEYYANFGESEFNRFRTQRGFEIKITRWLNYETY